MLVPFWCHCRTWETGPGWETQTDLENYNATLFLSRVSPCVLVFLFHDHIFHIADMKDNLGPTCLASGLCERCRSCASTPGPERSQQSTSWRAPKEEPRCSSARWRSRRLHTYTVGALLLNLTWQTRKEWNGNVSVCSTDVKNLMQDLLLSNDAEMRLIVSGSG